MGNCAVHIMGSDNAVDMITEKQLGASLAAKLDAISATYSALTKWEDAYVCDVQGKTDEAVKNYDKSIDGAALAIAKWKYAEYCQSDLISFFTSLPPELALRQSVADALENIEFQSHIKQIQREGRFPASMSVDNIPDMASLGLELFLVERQETVGLSSDKDSFNEIVNLFRVDQYQIRQLKLGVKRTQKTLEDNREDVVRSQLFERVGSAFSIDKEMYPLTPITAQLRVSIVNYIAYIEAYGSYVTRALMEARNDDTWAHVKAYLDG